MENVQSTTPTEVDITLRTPDFDFDGTPKVWLADPFKTHFMNALSVLIPHSERTVNEILRKNVHKISDPQLKKEVLVLIKQEGAHALMHRKSNQLLESNGYPQVRLFEKIQKKFMTGVRRLSTNAFEMAIPTAFEHFTSAISRDFLTHQQQWTEDRTNGATQFVAWHALEEIEHQAVCYDAYKAIYSSQWRLVLALLFCWMPLSVISTYTVQLYFLHKDRIIYKPKNWIPYLKFVAGSLRLFTAGIFKYRKPSFQPWTTADQALYDSALSLFKRQESQKT